MFDQAAGDDLRPVVLVVEDEALISMMIEEIIESVGCRAVCSLDGRAMFDGTPIEVSRLAAAVVDLGLRDGLDGRDVIRHLRSRNRTLPVAVVTGYTASAGKADLRGLGGPTVRFEKPFKRADVGQWLSDAMASRLPDRPDEERRQALHRLFGLG